MTRRLGTIVVTCCATLGTVLVLPAGALASFPGTNGRIAFVHDPGTPGSSLDIFAIDPTGQNPTQLTGGTEDDLAPSYSADGEKIAFARDPDGPGVAPRQIWVMNADGSGQTQLTLPGASGDRAYEPSFSPDGQRIAFQRDQAGEVQIWIMNADGSGQTQLTLPGASGDRAYEPSFSPDGQRIAFSRRDGATGFWEIWVMNPEGSGQTRLTSGSASSQDFEPDFSADGQKILFRRYDGSQSDIWVMNADGSGQAPVTDTASDNDNYPAFSPDGTRIAFEREDAGGNFGNILLANPTGLNQDVTPLTTNSASAYDYQPSWQPLNPPSCDISGQAKSRSLKQVSVTVTCTNENATAVVEGSGKAPKAPKGAVTSKARMFKIPAVTAEIPEGTPTNVTLKIPKRGKKALKKAAKVGKKGKATITATLTDDLGQSSTDQIKVKFKAKEK